MYPCRDRQASERKNTVATSVFSYTGFEHAGGRGGVGDNRKKNLNLNIKHVYELSRELTNFSFWSSTVPEARRPPGGTLLLSQKR